jgi:transcriptional/translational regulatory protein YebC/TACO1
MDALRAGGYPVASSEIAMVPRNLVTVEGADAQKVLKLIDALEELDDVSKVFTNLDIDAVDLAEAEA